MRTPATPRAREAGISPALLEANRRLLQRRAAHRRTKGPDPVAHAACLRRKPDSAAHAACLPPTAGHIGWHSAPLSDHLRQIATRKQSVGVGSWTVRAVNRNEKAALPPPPPRPQSSISIPIAPDLAAAFLRHDLAGPGRIWLLLRHIDADGRGWLGVDHVRARLTATDSPLRICSWRQLRNLLREGQGILWQQDGPAGNGGRLWLRKPAKVALALGLNRVGGRAVALPLPPLLAGIGEVRAQLYAAFHSGRAAPHGNARPIARETIARLTGVPRRTQIAYEARAGIDVRPNYAVGERATPAASQERAWKQGGTFHFVDGKGEQGKENATYVAWQMPNTYVGPHKQHSKQRTRRINADLADLRTQGGAGNGREPVEKLYFADGAAAARAFNRDHSHDAYWPACHCRNGSRLWFVVAAQE